MAWHINHAFEMIIFVLNLVLLWRLTRGICLSFRWLYKSCFSVLVLLFWLLFVWLLLTKKPLVKVQYVIILLKLSIYGACGLWVGAPCHLAASLNSMCSLLPIRFDVLSCEVQLEPSTMKPWKFVKPSNMNSNLVIAWRRKSINTRSICSVIRDKPHQGTN